jgi:hypothetical protein
MIRENFLQSGVSSRKIPDQETLKKKVMPIRIPPEKKIPVKK